MLSNAYFLAKFRFDTAENEPAKNLQNLLKIANFADPNPLLRREEVKQNGGRTEVLRECQKTIIHCFSLMNALALTSLSTCVGWAQYKKHNESVTSDTYFRPVLGCIDADLCK